MKLQHNALVGLALSLVLALSAAAWCSGCASKPMTPEEAMKAKDYALAASLYARQLEALKPIEDAWQKAKFGHVQAVAHADKQKAKAEALEVLAAHGKDLGERRIASLANALAEGGAATQAYEFLAETVALFPDSIDLDSAHSRMVERAAKEGSKEDKDKLAGLGYVGGASHFVPRPNTKTPEEQFPKS